MSASTVSLLKHIALTLVNSGTLITQTRDALSKSRIICSKDGGQEDAERRVFVQSIPPDIIPDNNEPRANMLWTVAAQCHRDMEYSTTHAMIMNNRGLCRHPFPL